MAVTATKKKMKTASATPFTPSFIATHLPCGERWSRFHSWNAVMVSAVEIRTQSIWYQ